MRRIAALASLVDKDSKVIDIGTDHAYLPIYLYEHGFTTQVTGSDVSKNVLEYGKKNLKKHNLDKKIDLILSNGFQDTPGNYDIAVISGMGFNTIKEILSFPVLPKTIIISSHNDLMSLRKFMNSLNYKIDKEIFLLDKNRYYVMIKYVLGFEALKPEEIILGVNPSKEYISYLLDKYKNIYNKSHNEEYLDIIKLIEKKLDCQS